MLHLDAFGLEVLDQLLGVGFLLVGDDLERAFLGDGVGVVLLERGELLAIAHIGAEAPDVDLDLLALGRFAQIARQVEQIQRLVERDLVHVLALAQAGELGFFLVVLGADLHERAETADTHDHRLAGLRIGAEFARLGDFLARQILLGIDLFGEAIPELLEQRLPLLLAARDRVEAILEIGGELVVHIAGEVIGQELVDDFAQRCGHEGLAVHFHILAILQRGNDRGIGRRPTDIVFLKGFHQRGFREARRRLGEMLGRHDFGQLDQLAFLEMRQALVGVVVALVVVLAFLVDRQETRLAQGTPRGAEQVAIVAAGGQVCRHRIEQRMHHLAGDGALPDQLVEPRLIAGEVGLDLVRNTRAFGRADGFVGLLRVLGLGLEAARRVRQVLVAVALADHRAQFADCVRGQTHRVGPHVGDQTGGLAAVDGNTFIQALGRAHGALGREAELARGFLLQRGRRERRRRIAFALLAVDLGDAQLALGRLGEGFEGRVGAALVVDGELLDLLAVELVQTRAECLGVLLGAGLDLPVFLRNEGLDLGIAFADQTQGRALYAAGGQAALNLAPE